MIQRALDRAYRRLGPRYPQVTVVAQLQLAYPVLLVSIAVLGLYLDMTAGEYLRLVLVGAGGFFIYNLAYAAAARPLLEPVRRWLAGERGHEETIDAWRTCSSFPREMMRREWLAWLPAAFGQLGLLLWATYATWELDLPAYTLLPLFAGMAVFVLYVQSLRFFFLEQILRPVLGDIARRRPTRWTSTPRGRRCGFGCLPPSPPST
jgi:adenylate cyclase